MTLNNIEKIAVDANAILSAVIGKAALRIFTDSKILFVTTDFNIEEVKKYLPRLALKYALPLDLLQCQLSLLPIKVYRNEDYKNFLQEADKLIASRDPNDSPLVALALKFGIPVWSNDRDLESTGIELYTTEKLLKKLNI
jgi:predicted nucleic acid-binding protein